MSIPRTDTLIDDLEDISERPLTRDDFARMKRVPRIAIIRQTLGLTQEEFAARYQIPLGTLRDWEQGRAMPDATARAYLKVIAAKPDMVAGVFGEVIEERMR